MYLNLWNYRKVTKKDKQTYRNIQDAAYIMYQEVSGEYLWNKADRRPWTATLELAKQIVDQLNRNCYDFSSMEEIRVP